MHRQKPLQISAFTDVFHEMESDDQLTLKVLRMKAITLLALVTMTRPSVLAPKGKQFNVRSQSFDPVIMSRDDVHFEDDGTMTVKFWSIKNDTNRQGFKVNVPPSNDTKCDQVQCLKTYIDRANQFTSDSYRPLFMALRPPFKAISADTVGNILEEAIAVSQS